jgi:homoserine O-acetyltransferase
MGGMTTLEWPLNTPSGFVRHIIPLATSARHSAWCISWGEAQRQSIYSDPDYGDGYYYSLPDGTIDLSHQPTRGLGAARMSALLTYRSRDSFESRFGRRAGLENKVPKGGVRIMGGRETTNPLDPGEADLVKSPGGRAWREHNDGHRGRGRKGSESSSHAGSNGPGSENGEAGEGSTSGQDSSTGKLGTGGDKVTPKVFSAQSYLRYQGDKVSFL